jgi:methionyl-tRNA formyltransferase
MRLIFAGTPDFAAVILAALLDSAHDVVGVLTQPDRRAGRGKTVRPGPVKRIAQARGLTLLQPQSLKDDQPLSWLRGRGAQAMIVAAYGLILPPVVLDLFAHGCINVHASLLPRWRGAAPIQRAIMAGDERSGVAIMSMDEGLDTGPVYASQECAIHPRDTTPDLHDRLAGLGARTLLQTLDAIEHGGLRPVPQDTRDACYAHKLHKDEALLDWPKPAAQLDREVRALVPWPVAHTHLGAPLAENRLRVHRASVADAGGTAGEPGTLTAVGDDGIVVACGEGTLRLETVQRPGRQPVTAAEFLRGMPLRAGQQLS